MFCNCTFLKSTVGKKITMAASGLILVGFVVGHMLGNLKIFMGRDEDGVYKIDHYAEFLRMIGADIAGPEVFLWGVRVVLVLALIAHVASAISLSILNRRAKPQAAAVRSYRSANAASRTMLYGGIVLLIFVTLHILHFTTGQIHSDFVYGKVYQNVWIAFQSKLIAGLYVIAMAALGAHLYHGIWSMFQTLGVDSPKWNSGIRNLAKIVSVALFIGFSAVPLAITTGILASPQLASPQLESPQ